MRIKIKLLAVFSVFGLILSACNSTDPADVGPPPTILKLEAYNVVNLDTVSVDSLYEDEDVNLRVVAQGTLVSYAWTHDGVSVGTSSPFLTLPSVPQSDSGSIVRCIVSNAGGKDTAQFKLKIYSRIPNPVLLTTRDLVAGAQSNASYGSSIDLDGFTAYTITQAKTMTSNIDLIFAYSTALSGGSSAIYSPDTAKGGINGSSGFDFMSDFNNPNHTVIKNVIVNASSIDTKAKLDSLWDVGSPVLNGRLTVVTGTTFMARSNEDRIVLVHVTAIVSGANGSANFKGYAKF